jgi:hypothetical protein
MDKQDSIKIDMIPRWLRVSMIVLKGIMMIIPFIVSSIAMMWESDMTIMESGLWNCIWMMSLIQIINYADEK